MIYGNVFLKEEYGYFGNSELILTESQVDAIYEFMIRSCGEEVLCEANFTKKQLQDPNTFKELLNKFEKEDNVFDKLALISIFLSFAEAIALGVATGSILVGLLSPIPIFTVKAIAYLKINSWITKYREGEIDKLYRKCEKLKETSLKIKDPKGKEIASNCDKLLKEIDKYNKKEAKKKFDQNIKLCRARYLDVINATFDYPDDAYKYIVDRCKISRDYINKKIRKNCKAGLASYNVNEMWGDEDIIEDLKKSNKKFFPEFYNDGKVNFIHAIDDTVLVYSPKSDSFWYGDWSVVKEYKNITDIPGYASKDWNVGEPDSECLKDEYLKVVDAQEGYFFLTDPPKGVKRKELKI